MQSWYFHALPLLLWYPASGDDFGGGGCGGDYSTAAGFSTGRLLVVTLGVMAAVEWAFLTFPATPTSSAVLQVAHGIVLWHVRPPPRILLRVSEEKEDKEEAEKWSSSLQSNNDSSRMEQNHNHKKSQ